MLFRSCVAVSAGSACTTFVASTESDGTTSSEPAGSGSSSGPDGSSTTAVSGSSTTDPTLGTNSTSTTSTETTAAETTQGGAVCGDDLVEGMEECDDGELNGVDGERCTAECLNDECGDGHLGPGEACDDGNTVDDETCPANCASPNCGNAFIDADETCDGALLGGETCVGQIGRASCRERV